MHLHIGVLLYCTDEVRVFKTDVLSYRFKRMFKTGGGYMSDSDIVKNDCIRIIRV